MNNGELPIFRGYMQFTTDVSTRAQLATNMRGKEFGVFGYEYNTTTTWNFAKANTTPQTFYNQKVECDSSGNCTYDVDNTQGGSQYKKWEDKHYAFFAYHPFEGSGITFSDPNAVNTPMLTYTYGWYNTPQRVDATNSEDIFDLMTAEHVDADGSTNVGLNFKHRMFAIEVLANNYNENVYEYDTVPVYVKDANGEFVLDVNGNKVQSTDKDGNLIYEDVIRKDPDTGENVIAEGGNARETLDLVTIKLENLRHNTMTIPLSMASEEAKPVYSGPATPFSKEFIVSLSPVEIPAYNETIIDEYGERGGGIPTSISKLGSSGGGYIMLIPQDAIQGAEYNISFSLNWLNRPTGSDVKTNFKSTIDFEPGRLYQVIINFVGEGITIALIEAGSWDPLTVEHSFE